jgi:oligopeptide/dipeptide ABC transporter ATP-binding protein
MYLWKVVQDASRAVPFQAPKHPHTDALISSSTAIDTGRTDRIRLTGDVPDPEDRPTGCFFHPRCHKSESYCGWSGGDVLSILQANVTEDDRIETLYDELEDTEFDGYHARFEFGDGVDIERVKRELAGEEDTLRVHNEELFDAVTKATVDDDAVELAFREIETPELIEDESGRNVACHLYDDDYQ